jgi:hypothetical protein
VTATFSPKLEKEVNSLARHLCGLSAIGVESCRKMVTPPRYLARARLPVGKATAVLCGEVREGVAAWKEKRPGNFKGK